jgi:Sec-independent protein translocase protein TatA
VGFGMEILFVLMLGLLVLGPKRLHTMLAHVARAKAELENATRGLKSQLAAELDAAPGAGTTDCSHVFVRLSRKPLIAVRQGRYRIGRTALMAA